MKSRRKEVVEISAIVTVPTVLLVIHWLLSEKLRHSLALFVLHPRPITFVTSSFVHLTDAHLLANLAGYACGAVSTYSLCRRLDRQTWFLKTLIFMVFILPAATSVTNIAVLTLLFPGVNISTYGFSGVVAGFLGFLFVLLGAVTAETFDGRLAAHTVTLVVSVCVALLVIRYTSQLMVVSMAVVGLGFSSIGVVRGIITRMNNVVPAEIALIAIVGVLCISLSYVAFPPDPVRARTNVYAHFTGIIGGAVLAEITRRSSSKQ